jgi:uncharacterized membrane protein YvbJ
MTILALFFKFFPFFFIFLITFFSYLLQYYNSVKQQEINVLQTEILELKSVITQLNIQVAQTNCLIQNNTQEILVKQNTNTSLTIIISITGAIILVSCLFYFLYFANSDINTEILVNTVPTHITETAKTLLESVSNNSLVLSQGLDNQFSSLHSNILTANLALIKLESSLNKLCATICPIDVSKEIAIAAIKASQSQW